MKTKTLLLALSSTLILSACGNLTGIPAHGGGKRFAVEQELVAASSRAALKDLDLSALAGKKVALYVTMMGDEGSGVMAGGRYSIEGLIRGEYASSPKSYTDNSFPTTVSVAEAAAGGMTSTTTATQVLNYPSHSESYQKGSGNSRYGGVRVNGQGDYRNETLITNPRDANYLTNLVQTLFFLRGIEIVPPQMADTDVFVTVDVFGTIRSRMETFIYNNESLKAVTKLEVFAVDRKTRKLVIAPVNSSFETQYKEEYVLWSGPFNTSKKVKESEGMLVDFSDVEPYENAKKGTFRVQKFTEGSNEQPQNFQKEVIDRRIEQRRNQ